MLGPFAQQRQNREPDLSAIEEPRAAAGLEEARWPEGKRSPGPTAGRSGLPTHDISYDISKSISGARGATGPRRIRAAEFLSKLDPYYNAIEREGANLSHFTEKQDFLNSVYEQFLPRIPFAPDFHAFAEAGKELARLHVEYESLEPWPLEAIENKDVPYSERVTKMKLSADRRSLKVNESITLSGIPAETFEYRLGSRSALEWVIDQYQVKGESDPNREDDPGYIVRLVGQVTRVSVETARIVKCLPNYLA